MMEKAREEAIVIFLNFWKLSRRVLICRFELRLKNDSD